jgi:broad specificity phosphatase PhoE
MGVIYLVRHGQASAHAYGALSAEHGIGGLTETGRAQMRATGELLAQRVPALSAAVSGTLARQRESLSLIVEQFREAPAATTDQRWNEYDLDSILGGTGRAATTTGNDPELQRLVDTGLSAWVAGDGPVGHESFGEFSSRSFAALCDLRSHAGSGQTALAVASAGVIMAIVAQLWGSDPDRWITMARTMINASVSKLIVGRNDVSVVSLNEHSHLDHDDGSGGRPLMTFR